MREQGESDWQNEGMGVSSGNQSSEYPIGDIQENGQQAAGGETNEEYLTVADKKKEVRKSTYVLAVLFCIGLVCLFVMIKKAGPKGAEASVVGSEEAQIEMAITRVMGARSEIFGRMDEIVKKFYEFSEVPQVEGNELVKNPFRTEMFLGDLGDVYNPEESDSDIEFGWQQGLSGHMELFSIMQTKHGSCCMIDDKILYEGDSIRGYKVSKIGSNFVKLKKEQDAEGDSHSEAEIILKLEE